MAITIAVLGTGSIGTRHYNCLAQIEGVTPVAVPTRPERVAELQAQGINALDHVPDEAVGIVIATDTARHLSDWQKFQERYCLVEKPLAGDITPELETLVAQTQGRAFTACVLRFNSTLEQFKYEVDSISKMPNEVLIKCHSFLPEWRPNRDYRTLYSAVTGQGGALRELVHEIDYAGWIFGWPFSVSGKIGQSKTIEIGDEDRAIFVAESKQTRCNFDLSIASKVNCRRITARYPTNNTVADLIGKQITFEGEPQKTIRRPEPRDAMYTRQLEAFIRAIQGQDPAPLATAEEGLKALQVIQAVRLSSATGKPVNL